LIEVKAPLLCRKWAERRIHLYIPGGWTMRVPSYRIEGEFEDAYIAWFRRTGLSFEKAEQAMKKAIQKHASTGFKSSLMKSVWHYARTYAEMYPERLKPAPCRKPERAFVLEGYDPEIMQTVHVPGYMPPPGGQPLARKLLMEMGNA
jgi:hypothetical protein